jgi:hypothetical protein
MDILAKKATELDDLSKALADVERRLAPVETDYQQFVDDFEIGLWTKHQDEDAKLPSAAMRLKLARQAMDPELLGRYIGLVKSRERMRERISVLKATVDAQRSILSALKLEMEASGAGQRRVTA